MRPAKVNPPSPGDVAVALAKSVKHNVAEYNARVQALRDMHDQGVYNPAGTDPAVLSKQASEAMRSGVSASALSPARDNTFNIRDSKPDRQAESMAKAKGWDGHAKEETEDQGGQAGEDGEGDARVQARPVAFGLQAGAQSTVAQAGNSDSAKSIGSVPQVEVKPCKDQAEAQAVAQKELEGGAISATIRVKYSVVVVREL